MAMPWLSFGPHRPPGNGMGAGIGADINQQDEEREPRWTAVNC